MSLTIMSSCDEQFVELKPIVLENDQFIEEPTLATPEFLEHIVTVLKHYDHKFELKEGKVFISEKLFDDKEIMYNYTKKAQDDHWLEKHSQ